MTQTKDPRIQLRNRTLATCLAILIPGLGHFYQRRIFKGFIYLICIMGTFFFGISLGEGRTVYMRYYQKSRDHGGETRNWNIGYASQVLVGLAAIPAIYQDSRYENQGPLELKDYTTKEPVQFDGHFLCRTPDGLSIQIPTSGKLMSRVEQEPTNIQGIAEQTIVFNYEGTAVFPGEQNPRTFAYNSLSSILLERRIYASPRFHFDFDISQPIDNGYSILRMQGDGASRPFTDWYQVPPSDEVLNDLNGRLGKYWELAMVFTWIAGLLNVLAIWDAAEGPAYGYGDKTLEPEKVKEGTVVAEKMEAAAQPVTAAVVKKT
jgi:hypothetical protein